MKSETFPNAAPTGKLYRVKMYSEMLQFYDLTKFDPPMQSNFGYVQTWVPGLGTGSVSIYTIMQRADIDRLYAMQYDQQATAAQKMNFLIYAGMYVRPCWTAEKGADGNWLDWRTSPTARVGACIYTNQLVMVDKIEMMKVKYPNQGYDAYMQMGRLVCFKKTDWGKTYATNPELIHHVTGVHDNNIHNEYPFGEVFLPLFDPVDFDIHPVPTNPEFKKEYWAYLETLKEV